MPARAGAIGQGGRVARWPEVPCPSLHATAGLVGGLEPIVKLGKLGRMPIEACHYGSLAKLWAGRLPCLLSAL